MENGYYHHQSINSTTNTYSTTCSSPVLNSAHQSYNNYYSSTPVVANQQSYYSSYYNYPSYQYNTSPYAAYSATYNAYSNGNSGYSSSFYDSGYQTIDTTNESNVEQTPSPQVSRKRKYTEDKENVEPVEKRVAYEQDDEEEDEENSSKRPKVFRLQSFTAEDLKCNVCQIEFDSLAKSFMHKHRYHDGLKSTQCPLCHKTFNNQANAMVHLRVHTGEKTYRCAYCESCFGDSSTLKKHERTHTGEKPYQCNKCPKRFSQSGNLKRHLLVHEKYDVVTPTAPATNNQSIDVFSSYTVDSMLASSFNFEQKYF